MLMQRNEMSFRANWNRWVRNYPGRYIAVIDGKVMAVSTTRLGAFRKVEKKLPPKKEVGLFYIPSPKQFPMILHAISLPRN